MLIYFPIIFLRRQIPGEANKQKCKGIEPLQGSKDYVQPYSMLSCLSMGGHVDGLQRSNSEEMSHFAGPS